MIFHKAFNQETSKNGEESLHKKSEKKFKDRMNYEVILLAQNRDGYTNLCKLITEANIIGFYYVPRVDWSILEKYSENLICILSGKKNPISEPFFNNQEDLYRLNSNIVNGIFNNPSRY